MFLILFLQLFLRLLILILLYFLGPSPAAFDSAFSAPFPASFAAPLLYPAAPSSPSTVLPTAHLPSTPLSTPIPDFSSINLLACPCPFNAPSASPLILTL